MVGITSVNQGQIDQFIDETGITYPILQDESSSGGQGGFGGVIYDDYYIPNQGSPYPRDFIIDQNGILVYANNEVDTEYMIYIVGLLLEGEDIVHTVSETLTADKIKIFPGYPNPFNPKINIPFYTEEPVNMTVGIYDNLGRLVKEILTNDLVIGHRTIYWNAINQSSGVYFIRINNGPFNQIQKIVLIK